MLSRRYAEFSSSVEESPLFLQGLSIPVPPENKPTVNKKNIRSRTSRLEQEISLSAIDNIEFELFSTEEIDTYAEVNITKPGRNGRDTVGDLRMGPHSEGTECPTCGSDLFGCPGHYGKIVIPRILHPLCINPIILTLSCICFECSRLLVTSDDLISNGIDRLYGISRLEAIHSLIRKIEGDRELRRIRQCQHGVLGHGGISCERNPIYAKSKEQKRDYKIGMFRKEKQAFKLIGYLQPDLPENVLGKSVFRMLDAIPDEDARLLGFRNSHPRTMIPNRLLVIPYCARPDMFQGDVFYPDDLTSMYMSILDAVIAYNANIDISLEPDLYNDVYKRISNLFRYDNKFNKGSNAVVSDIRKRLQGKTGIIRSNLMGKRVNFAGRSVIGPAHYLRVDRVGIPRLMARQLTRPFIVFEFNRVELQSKYDAGKIIYITPKNGKNAGNRQMVGDAFVKHHPDYQLQIGDKIERMLEDGDIVLVNRQPTLHKQNILALRTTLIDDRIIRLNLTITTPLNADFDGDEANIHVPQTIEAMAEAEQLLAVQMNLLNSASGKPIMGLVYDTLSGAYIMTYPENEVERINIEIAKSTLRADSMTAKIANLNRTSPDRYSQVREEIEALTSENMILQQDIDDMKSRLIELSNRINVDPIVFNQCIDKIAGSPQLATLPNRLSKYGINPHGGRALISACFPDDFDYNIKNVVIKEGVLISGVLTKETLGTADNSIISEMTKQLGSMDTVDFMSDIQFVVSTFMQQHGLSVGAIDCMPNDPMFKSQLDEILATASLKVISYSGKPSNQIIAEARERKIQEALDVAKSEGDKIVQKYFKPDNAILIMANSGAKGTVFNAIQMSSMLAQQKVSGKRIQPVLPGERTLPSTQPGTRDPKDFGFCVNSFTSGLEPSEFFYHAAGGREGITDTAIGASSTGYLQHQLIKSAEDIHISTDGSVRSADNTLIQFVYGEDGFDAAELTKVKIHNEVTPMFRNIEMLADKINRKYATQ